MTSSAYDALVVMALPVSLLALLFGIVALFRTRRPTAGAMSQPSGDMRALLHALKGRIAEIEEESASARDRERVHITVPGLIHFCAYGAEGPALSFSLALLDARLDGVVLTSLYSRDQIRLYAKSIHAGRAEVDLAEEERLAVELVQAGGGHRVLDGCGAVISRSPPRLPSRRRQRRT